MAQQIDSEKLLVNKVFEMWFRIPEYQRPYVWETDQVNELLSDIMSARESNQNSQYFLGSMVLRKVEKSENGAVYDEFDLLDGQQRLTTIFLITAVIRDIAPKSNKVLIELCNSTIFRQSNQYDNVPERMRIVFDIRDEVRDFVNKYIKPIGGTNEVEDFKKFFADKETDVSIRNMSNAILTIRSFFSENNFDHFFQYLRSNVLMIYVAAVELDDAFKLFTVLNSRGIKLRNSDILKSNNLAVLKNEPQKIRDWAKKWEEIENYFNEDFDNFLSHLRTILVKRKASVSLLKEFETNIYYPNEFDRATEKYKSLPPLLNMGEETFQFVEKHYKNYIQLFENDNFDITNSYELYNHLTLMRLGFEADIWIPPLLSYYAKFNEVDLIKFMKILENKFAFDWLYGLSPTKRIENMNAIIKMIDNSSNPFDIFNSTDILDFSLQDLKHILSGPIYGNRGSKYLLMKFDLKLLGYNQKFQIPATISIEHILPQNPNPNSQWVNDFSPEQREIWTNKIGNLVLISRRKNSSQGNKDYAIKKEKYFKTNIELFSNSIRIFQKYNTWSYDDLLDNNMFVLNEILDSFNIEKITFIRTK